MAPAASPGDGVPPVPCRVCGARDTAFLCRTFNTDSATQWLSHYRCRDCGSVFIGNAIPADELAQAYAAFDAARYYRETADSADLKFRAAAEELASLVAPSARILDIGGGDGGFVRALKARGFADLAIHEIPEGDWPGLTAVVRAIYRDADYTTIPDAAFDAVTLMDVMEHVASPDATLAAVARVLRPGGLLYLHTPVVTWLDRLMHLVQKLPLLARIGRAWQPARTSVFHLQNYTPRALRRLMDRYGFAVQRLECRNELTSPVARYVRVYLIEKRGLPKAFAPPLTRLLTPVLRSRLNANKGVLVARKPTPAR
ncbi:MAG: methyltransferase domain-containing protein [Rhodopseudomonas sp.]|nr:methyltransferase domain-containing protein [Rhodopseudomonas sp.]